jgi:hypothetical protein
MRVADFLIPTGAGATLRSGPALIAIGLAVLVAATWWPAAPVISALAVVILGATAATLSRFSHHRALCPMIALHLFVYGGLYLMFIGAAWHAAATGQRSGRHIWQTLDLAASVFPMGLAARWSIAALLGRMGGEDATPV